MSGTLKVQKTEPVQDVPLSVASVRVSQRLTNATDGDSPMTIPDYLQDSHSRRMWGLPVVHPGSMQLTAEQALAAAASGCAVVHAVCTHQR